ncbi:hypothetical protein NDU88_000936 [Pleurodeles waltl]|uniref:Uncharacterized protein n=1 Tax=Pleurodeles waltl TaxID=8319 RepID=A0AAV7WJ05_PLEWA|nr:hypothetical protein NDU88_000936 [Pleurodeles waltl]
MGSDAARLSFYDNGVLVMAVANERLLQPLPGTRGAWSCTRRILNKPVRFGELPACAPFSIGVLGLLLTKAPQRWSWRQVQAVV